MIDYRAIAESLHPVIEKMIGDAVAPLQKSLHERELQIAELNGRIAELKAVTAEDVLAQLDGDALAQDIIKLLPTPEPGKDGRDGPTLEEVTAAVSAANERRLSEALAELSGKVDAAIKAIPDPPPAPEPGKDGRDGPTLEEVTAAVSAANERRLSDFLLSAERRIRDATDKALDKIPAPKDGKDALSVQDFSASLDERKLTIKLGDGENEKSVSLTIPAIIDRGVWSADKQYEKGDAVSHAGSLWIAQVEEPTGQPGGATGADSWRLAVKRGKDGRDLRDNASKHDKSKGAKL